MENLLYAIFNSIINSHNIHGVLVLDSYSNRYHVHI